MSVNCIICMDSGYLATHKDDEDIIVPLHELKGSELCEYRVQRCTCNKQAIDFGSKEDIKNESATVDRESSNQVQQVSFISSS